MERFGRNSGERCALKKRKDGEEMERDGRISDGSMLPAACGLYGR